MLKQLMIAKKLEALRSALSALLEDEKRLATRGEELEAAIAEAKTDEEIKTVEEAIDKLDEDKGELEEKKGRLNAEIAELEGELEQLNAKAPTNSERSKGVDTVNKQEIRSAIATYVRSKGRVLREMPSTDPKDVGFVVEDGGALIPEEILTPEEFRRDVVDLSKYVRTIKVNRGSGKLPVITKSGSKMYTVEELEKNPALAKPEIDEVPYDIDTYRGYIPISSEAIEDADYDIVGLIAEEIADQELNTKNAAIAAILKAATAETAEGLDGLKAILNTKLKRVYDVKLFVSASLYNELDTLKDKNGRYLLQDSITSPSGKSFAGRELIVLDDEMIGDPDETNPQFVAFVGDAREFCTLFDRKRISVKWVDNNIYGELLAGFVRFDAAEVDGDAGYYVTYTPVTEDDPLNP